MVERVMVVYQGETMPARQLAKRLGVSQSCISKRWLNGRRGEDLVAPSQKGRGQRPGRTVDQREAFEVAEKQRQAEQTSVQRSLELRHRARERAAQIRREHAAAFSRPLINDDLLTIDERIQNERKVKGRQRWNAGWFGESHDSRESTR